MSDSTQASHARVDRSALNTELINFLVLPSLFLMVALLGGVRVGAETRALMFVAPPLVALILAALLLALFARGGLIDFRSWLNISHAPIVNLAHALTLLALFFAAAQAFNSVLPERGLLHGLFAFFFLWTLWNNLFTSFDARALLRSVAVLFGTAFFVKHFLLASLFGAERSLLERLTGALLEGASLGALSAPPFAPATGYISFFTLALFIVSLALTPRSHVGIDEPTAVIKRAPRALELYARLTPAERRAIRELMDAEDEPVRLQPDSGSSSATTSSRTTS